MMNRKLCIVGLAWVLAVMLGTSSKLVDAEDSKTSGGKGAKIVYRENIIYGQVHGAGLLADVAFPESKAPLPAILSVHGGRWQGGHKRDTSTINVKQWAGCTPPPACYQDLQCAVRYLHAHSKQFNIDTDRIFLIGQSAGGHLVSLAATLGDGPFPRTGGWEAASNDFRAVISLAANYELNTLSWGDIWTPASGDPIEARALASPVNHVRKEIKPLLILHSDNDRSVPIENALLMVTTLKASGARHTFHRYPTAGHMQVTDEVIERALEFIREHST